MIFTDYYKFVHKAGTKSKHRVDCTASTQSYPPMEGLRKTSGELFVYVGENTHIGGKPQRRAGLAMTKKEHISSIYQPTLNGMGFGDMVNTSDALLFILSNYEPINGALNDGATVEVFVARGEAKSQNNLFTMAEAGEFDEELNHLRREAEKYAEKG